jgi:hypothetical protein
MGNPIQQDLFGGESQRQSLEEETAAPAYQPNLDDVRARLNKILTEARAAKALPWDADKTLLYRTIFPHMAGWLPREEGEQLTFEFGAEMARLKAA